MTEIAAAAGTYESKKEAKKATGGDVARWLTELELADKAERDWREAAAEVIKRIREEKAKRGGKVRYNILASNVATMQPALYAQSPRPDIRPRNQDNVPPEHSIERKVATLIEKAVAFHLDAYDFDGCMDAATYDTLAPGRAVSRVRYKPVMQTVTPGRVPVMAAMQGGPFARQDTGAEVAEYQTDAETGETYIQDPPYEKKAYEETCPEHVHWDDFRRGPGRAWREVPWIAFRHKFTREQLVEKFGAVGSKIELDYEPEGLSGKKDNAANDDAFKRAIVWEIWEKPTRKVHWLVPSYKTAIPKTEDDPLELSGFFPCPRPLYARFDPSNLVPTTDYSTYRDQAEELDTITRRISIITAGLKFRGMYDSTIKGMKDLISGEDNDFLPVEGAAGFTQNGGLDKALFFLPIERAATVLEQLYRQRAEVKQEIFELSGIADIMRGSTNANETLGAQKIKAQWGTQRLQKRQRDVQRYARDLIRIMAEIIAEKYDPMTLKLMTGMEVDEQMLQVMRLDAVRSFRIDIETDSTIAVDTEADQANLAELTQGLGQMIQAFGPIVETGALPMEAVKAIIMSVTRKFKLGREVEDALDAAQKQPAQQQPNPQAQQAQADAQKHQLEMQTLQAEAQARQAKAAADIQAVQAKAAADQAKAQVEMEALERELQLARAGHAVELEGLELKREQQRAKAKAAQEGVNKSAA